MVGLSKHESMQIKGVAILMMLMHHLYCQASRFDGYEVSFAPFTQDFVVGFSLALKICVSLFAFISGYGLMSSTISFLSRPVEIEGGESLTTRWIARHLIKLTIGFQFIYLLCFVVTFAIDGYPLEVYFQGSRISGFLYIVIDAFGLAGLFGTPTLISTWWYMSAAILYIVMVPGIAAIKRKVGWLPVIVGYIALPRLMNIDYPGGVNPYTFLLSVMFGMLFCEYDLFAKLGNWKRAHLLLRKGADASWSPVYTLMFGALTALCIRVLMSIEAWKMWELSYGVIPVVVIVFLKFGVVAVPGISLVLQFLGERSMTIFLTHSFIRYTYLEELVYSNGSFLTNFAVLLALSLLLAVLIDLIKSLIHLEKLQKIIYAKLIG